MIPVGIFLIAGIIFGWIAIGDKNDWFEYLMGSIFMLLFGIMGLIVGFMAGIFIGVPLQSHWVNTAESELVPFIADSNGREGYFFLCPAQGKTKPNYVFYRTGENGVFGSQVQADETVIHEERDSRRGFIKSYERRFVNPRNNYIALTIGTRHEIFIPEGSAPGPTVSSSP